ncbi:FliH/SctL family protein [Thermaurantiacus sp.]
MSETAPLRALLGLAEPPSSPPPPDPEAIFAAGHAEGRAAAEAEAATRIAALEADHARALAAAEARAEALLAAAAEELAHLALAVARTVLGAEPSPRADVLARLLADLLAAVPSEARAELFAHPDALAALAPHVPEAWVLRGDPSLSPHALRAELAEGAVRASLDRRLAQLASALGADT